MENDDDIVAEEEEKPIVRRGKAPSRVIAWAGRNGIMQKIKTSEFQSSTKIEALVQEIQKMESADPGSKALRHVEMS